jgi:hypothetical protein
MTKASDAVELRHGQKGSFLAGAVATTAIAVLVGGKDHAKLS